MTTAAPGGGCIAFTSFRDHITQIYVMNADGSGQARLTDKSASESGPAWSPDGTRIAFVSERERLPGIFVMNSDGSGVTKLFTWGFSATDPSWSPDGAMIAFVSEGDIHVMNADGSNRVNLTNSSASSPDWGPAWSPFLPLN